MSELSQLEVLQILLCHPVPLSVLPLSVLGASPLSHRGCTSRMAPYSIGKKISLDILHGLIKSLTELVRAVTTKRICQEILSVVV